MKKTKYLSLALLAPLFLTACSDDDEVTYGGGNPVVSAQAISGIEMGDSLYVNVNVSDASGMALSTLKASLLYGEEEVSTTTVRTKTEGNYTVALYAPLYKDVPDGNAQVELTLTNVDLGKSSQAVDVAVARPRYANLTLTASDGSTFKLSPDASEPYLYRGTVNSADKTLLGKITAKGSSASAVEQTFALNTNGEVAQGDGDNIEFVSTRAGEFEVTFNTLTYAYTPVYDPNNVQTIEALLSSEKTSFEDNFVQGCSVVFTGDDAALFASDDWYVDPDYFQKNADGTFTFLPVDGKYHIEADYGQKGFYVWRLGSGSKGESTLSDDGSGAIWMIGNGGFMKPTYAVAGGHSWWTETYTSLCLPEISDKVFQLTLTVGKQLRADDVDFKFFGQCGWGTEFKGADHSHILSSSTTDVFYVKDSGNIGLQDGVTLNEGDTYRFTIDVTAGVDKAVLTVTKL